MGAGETAGRGRLILVLGGSRAGKSEFAQAMAMPAGKVLFVATAEAGDEDMARRIAAHRASRPASWDTLEEQLDLVGRLEQAARYDVVLIDCLTLWVSNHLLRRDAPPGKGENILKEINRLLALQARHSATWIMVSNEVGLGVVPPTDLGREFRDVLGRVNQAVARRADRVYLLVAGLAIELHQLNARPWQDTLGADTE